MHQLFMHEYLKTLSQSTVRKYISRSNTATVGTAWVNVRVYVCSTIPRVYGAAGKCP